MILRGFRIIVAIGIVGSCVLVFVAGITSPVIIEEFSYDIINERAVRFVATIRSSFPCSATLMINDNKSQMVKDFTEGYQTRFSSDLALGSGKFNVSIKCTTGLRTSWLGPIAINLTVSRPSTHREWEVEHIPLANISSLDPDPVVTARIVGRPDLVTNVSVEYSLNDSAVLLYSMEKVSGDSWSATIHNACNAKVAYRIIVVDNVGRTLSLPGSENRGTDDSWDYYMFHSKNLPLTVEEYLLRLRKSSGGFGLMNLKTGGLSWTRSALKSLSVLNLSVNQQSLVKGDLVIQRSIAREIWEYIWCAKYLNLSDERLTELSALTRRMAMEWESSNETGYFGPSQISDLYYLVLTLSALGEESSKMSNIIAWLGLRQNNNGGWSNIEDGDSHVSMTFYAIRILSALGIDIPNQESTIDWILGCQNDDRGFGWEPGTQSDVHYTFHAIWVLNALGLKPKEQTKCVEWLLSLQNSDGGFGPKNGWPSGLFSTEEALRSLLILGLETEELRSLKTPMTSETEPDLSQYNIFTCLLEGAGNTFGHPESPGFIVSYAERIGVDLIGLKTSNLTFVQECANYSARMGLDVTVIASDEQYHAGIASGSLGEYSHVGNWFGQVDRVVALQSSQPWQAFKEGIEAIHKAGGLLHFWHDLCPEFAYQILDYSASEEDGYDAFNANIEQTPWMDRYLGVMPLTSSVDAHKDLWASRDSYQAERVLFVSENHTWEGFVDAIRANRIVKVEVTPSKSLWGDTSYYTLWGNQQCVAYVEEGIEEWRWWGDDKEPPTVFCHVITLANSEDLAYRILGDDSDLESNGIVFRVYNSTSVVSASVDGRTIPMHPTLKDSFYSSYLYGVLHLIEPGQHLLCVTYILDGIVRTEEVIFHTF